MTQEIERAIEYFEGALKNADEFLSKGISCAIMAKQKSRLELIIPILRAELERQKNEPMTCEGCRRHEALADGIILDNCRKCVRYSKHTDHYEPKGEPNV